jgi:LCP family protein required for cell wall assembly
LQTLNDTDTGFSRTQRRRTRESSRRRRRFRWTIIIVATTLFVLLGSLFGYLWYLNSEIHRVKVKGLGASPTAGAIKNTENILLVGSTDRCALKQQNPAFGLCSQGVNGINSDVIMILHLDPNTHRLSILSIPRDTFVPNARTTGANKIDTALYQGPSQLVSAIQSAFGIPINHYVELNFDTFAGVVDALGGIRMYFPMPLYDGLASLNVPTAGCQTLNGFQALAVVRARHLQYKPPGVTSTDPRNWPQDPESDLSRIRRDHEFIRVLASAVAKRGLGNPFTDRALVATVAPNLQVDASMSVSDMVSLVLRYHTIDPMNAPQLTIPVTVNNSLSYVYQGTDFGSVEFPNQPGDQQVIDQFLGEKPFTDSMTGKALPPPASVNVAVLSGTGVPSRAATTAAQLQTLGFHITTTGSGTYQGPLSETVVTYASPANQAAAQTVAHNLSGAVVLAKGPTPPGSDVSLTTGSDFTVNPPPAPSPPPAAGPATSAPPTTTTTAPPASTSSSSNQLGAPTPATTPLAPFDPRSCTPSGGPGP